jgi:hypothetical protein
VLPGEDNVSEEPVQRGHNSSEEKPSIPIPKPQKTVQYSVDQAIQKSLQENEQKVLQEFD